MEKDGAGGVRWEVKSERIQGLKANRGDLKETGQSKGKIVTSPLHQR